MQNPEQLFQIAGSIESLVVAVAIVLGGIWTVFTFGRLGAVKRAEAELAELKQKISRTAQINVNVHASCSEANDQGVFLITSQATIENVGSRRTNLQFPPNDRPFHIVRVDIEPNGDLTLGQAQSTGIPYGDGGTEFSQRAVVGPGARVILPAAFLVGEPGLYLVSFSAFPSVDVHESLRDDGIENPARAQWTGRCYVAVGLNFPCPPAGVGPFPHDIPPASE